MPLGPVMRLGRPGAEQQGERRGKRAGGRAPPAQAASEAGGQAGGEEAGRGRGRTAPVPRRRALRPAAARPAGFGRCGWRERPAGARARSRDGPGGRSHALWRSGALALWRSGALALWRSGALALWRSGALALWRSGALALWRSGALALWRSGALALWRSGALALWRSGALALWRSGALALWRSGALALWRSGALALWRSGALALIVSPGRFGAVKQYPRSTVMRLLLTGLKVSGAWTEREKALGKAGCRPFQLEGVGLNRAKTSTGEAPRRLPKPRNAATNPPGKPAGSARLPMQSAPFTVLPAETGRLAPHRSRGPPMITPSSSRYYVNCVCEYRLLLC